ncbi:hypothetical protein EWH91_03720 [Sporolactobacillus sp. THM19-2]|nr:hypothetical protein EWH91_03720 [Sporolactobacillus sp. THM19-2]
MFILILSRQKREGRQVTADRLRQLRREIDTIDRELIGLLNQRARVVREVGKEKKAAGTAYTDSLREKEILNRIAVENRGPFPTASLQKLFGEIFEISKHLEKKSDSD